MKSEMNDSNREMIRRNNYGNSSRQCLRPARLPRNRPRRTYLFVMSQAGVFRGPVSNHMPGQSSLPK